MHMQSRCIIRLFIIAAPNFAQRSLLLEQAGGMAESVQAEDWTAQTLPSWRHSNWVGVWDPWIVVLKGPVIWYKVIREIIMIERMHRAFSQGLMEYGMIRAIKPHRQQQPQQQQQVSSRDAVLAELNQSLAAAQ